MSLAGLWRAVILLRIFSVVDIFIVRVFLLQTGIRGAESFDVLPIWTYGTLASPGRDVLAQNFVPSAQSHEPISFSCSCPLEAGLVSKDRDVVAADVLFAVGTTPISMSFLLTAITATGACRTFHDHVQFFQPRKQ
jgi:hypothetical protein